MTRVHAGISLLWTTTVHKRMSDATADERFHLITRRLQEVLGGEAIKTLLAQGKTPKCYWGACPSGSHIFQRDLIVIRDGADWQT